MAVLFTLTINTGSKSQGETMAAESSLVVHALQQAETAVGAGHSAAGSLFDRNGLSIGNYVYTAASAH